MMARKCAHDQIIGDDKDQRALIRESSSSVGARYSGIGHSWPNVGKENTNSGKVMADLKARFEKAAEDVKKLSERPDNDTLLKLYALYKQGSEGDVSGAKPGFFDFVGTAKYEAWAKLKGMKPEEAMQKYTDLVNKLGG
jgi:acyl-CoA-binding protein